jgi:hypothetical protein
MKNKIVYLAIGVSMVLITTIACSKHEKGESKLTVKMVDAPGDFQEVNVEVLEVMVHNEYNGWISLPTNAGIYDLLTLQNDVSATLVNQGSLPSGDITQFRMILGSNNTVMVDSIIYELKTPSAEQSGLKLNVKSNFDANELYEIIVDFDAEKSIVKKGNGNYSLKPVLKLESVNQL